MGNTDLRDFSSKLRRSSFYCHSITEIVWGSCTWVSKCTKMGCLESRDEWTDHSAGCSKSSLECDGVCGTFITSPRECCWQKCPPADNGNESWGTNTAALLRFSSVSAFLNTLSLSTAGLFLYSVKQNCLLPINFWYLTCWHPNWWHSSDFSTQVCKKLHKTEPGEILLAVAFVREQGHLKTGRN